MRHVSPNSVFSLKLLLRKENFPYEVILTHQNNFKMCSFFCVFGTSHEGAFARCGQRQRQLWLIDGTLREILDRVRTVHGANRHNKWLIKWTKT